MVFVGIEHGSTAVRCSILKNKKYINFEIERTLNKTLKKVSILKKIKKYLDLDDIKLLSLTYSMGDAIDKILPINKVKNRGVLSTRGVGEIRGLGERIFDEVKESKIPGVVIPGLHKNCSFLNEDLRLLYSHHAAPDKVAAAFFAASLFKKKGIKLDFILSDVSSNTVTVIVKDGKLIGGIDASSGAPGIMQGCLDVEAIRKIDDKILTANQAFSSGGLASKHFGDARQFFKALEKRDSKAKRLIKTLSRAVASEILSLLVYVNPEIIVIRGKIGTLSEPLDFREEVKKNISKFLEVPIILIDNFSAAKGAALIAKAVYFGEREILGIEVLE